MFFCLLFLFLFGASRERERGFTYYELFFLRSRKICDCLLGFTRNLHGKELFLNDIHSLQNFLLDPWDAAGVFEDGTVQIHVPKLALFDSASRDVVEVGDDSEVKVAASTQGKRTVVLLKKKKKKVADDSAANPVSDDFAVRFSGSSCYRFCLLEYVDNFRELV